MPLMSVMNFLNEIADRHPDAISFAPGRPSNELLDVSQAIGMLDDFVEHRAACLGSDRMTVFAELGQYGPTNGLITDLISRHLEIDEGIRVPKESIIVTSGAQEAMAIIAAGLLDPSHDALLASDPTYIGMTGIASLFGIDIVPVESNDYGCDPRRLEDAMNQSRQIGKYPKLLYLIPDFNNPLGTCLDLESREAILQFGLRHNVLIIEDNAYGMFSYDGKSLPTLKSLDRNRSVLYIGSFSKTVFPGLRIGYLVADQQARGNHLLSQDLSKVKSLLTVNTSPILQAILGGILLQGSCSLRGLVEPKLTHYRKKRDLMLTCLQNEFREESINGHVRWNKPKGGFFITVTLPFQFDQQSLLSCVEEFRVIVCPMSFFSLRCGRESQIRLSFSFVTEEQIADGIARLKRFVTNRACH
jgi:(S)-3,5-dihydroxyphenylglycine transaminase